MRTSKNFHLTRNPYIYRIDDSRRLVLIGNSVYDSESKECVLTLFFQIVGSNFDGDISSIAPDHNILGLYHCRSGKFKSGEFTVLDAQRYIKSRYRDIIRLANRQHNESDVLDLLNNLVVKNKNEAEVAEDSTFGADYSEEVSAAHIMSGVSENSPAVSENAGMVSPA